MRGIPLSYQERRIYHFQEYVDRVIGAENIPEELRAEPVLAEWCEQPWHHAAEPYEANRQAAE